MKYINILSKAPKHKLVIDPRGFRMIHPSYDIKEIEMMEETHRKPECFRDRWAKFSVATVRFGFDTFTRFNKEKMTED